MTTDEPTWTHHSYPKLLFTLGFTFGIVHYNGVSLWYHTEYFHCLEKPLCSAIHPSLLPQTLATADLLTTSIILSCLEYYIGEGNGTPLQYSCLENPMDRGAWWAAVHGVTKSRTRLSDFTLTFHFHAPEKEMATHSSVLAWRIPGTGEPGGLLSMGSHRVGHDWGDLA